MDRVNEIRQQIEKAVKEAMPQLTSTSKTAEYRQWINTFANIQASVETIINLDKAEMAALVANNRIGTPQWYVELAKQFQWSETGAYKLVVEEDTGIIKYNIVNPADRIITQAACTVSENAVTVKVATGEPGQLNEITKSQKLAITKYMNDLKIAGVKLDVISKPPDMIELKATVYYDKSYPEEFVRKSIIESLDRYTINLPYNGVILRNSIIDAIQAAEGVVDVELKDDTLKNEYSIVAYQDNNSTIVGRDYLTYSGYFTFKKDDGFPVLNFIKNDDYTNS